MITCFKNTKVVGFNIPQEVYRRRDEKIARGNPEYVMSRGELVDFAKNPARWILGGGEDEETTATAFGSLMDCLILTPSELDKNFAMQPAKYKAKGMKCPGCGSVSDSKSCSKCRCNREEVEIEKDWNSNATVCGEWNEKQRKDGKIIIPANMRTEAEAALAQFNKDEELVEFIKCSLHQVMIVTTYVDRVTKIEVPLKILLDVVPSKDHPRFGKSLGDLKTARDASHRGWRKAVAEHGYDVQGALYFDIYKCAFPGEDRQEWRHAILENVAPYLTGRRIVSSQFLEIGRGKYMAALQDYCACLKSGKWPSYDDYGNDRAGKWSMCEPDDWMADGMYGMNLREELLPKPAAEVKQASQDDLLSGG